MQVFTVFLEIEKFSQIECLSLSFAGRRGFLIKFNRFAWECIQKVAWRGGANPKIETNDDRFIMKKLFYNHSIWENSSGSAEIV